MYLDSKNIYIFVGSCNDCTITTYIKALILNQYRTPIESYPVQSDTLNRGFFLDQTLITPLIGTDKYLMSLRGQSKLNYLFGYFFLSLLFLLFCSCSFFYSLFLAFPFKAFNLFV